jgi:hypothetical protein
MCKQAVVSIQVDGRVDEREGGGMARRGLGGAGAASRAAQAAAATARTRRQHCTVAVASARAARTRWRCAVGMVGHGGWRAREPAGLRSCIRRRASERADVRMSTQVSMVAYGSVHPPSHPSLSFCTVCMRACTCSWSGQRGCMVQAWMCVVRVWTMRERAGSPCVRGWCRSGGGGWAVQDTKGGGWAVQKRGGKGLKPVRRDILGGLRSSGQVGVVEYEYTTQKIPKPPCGGHHLYDLENPWGGDSGGYEQMRRGVVYVAVAPVCESGLLVGRGLLSSKRLS